MKYEKFKPEVDYFQDKVRELDKQIDALKKINIYHQDIIMVNKNAMSSLSGEIYFYTNSIVELRGKS